MTAALICLTGYLAIGYVVQRAFAVPECALRSRVLVALVWPAVIAGMAQ